MVATSVLSPSKCHIGLMEGSVSSFFIGRDWSHDCT